MSYQDYPASTTNSVNLSSRKKRRGMIEKRRRDKINSSLTELRRLVPAAFEKEGSAKLEKAEILQMTVDYLRMLHERGMAGSLTTSIKPDSEATVGAETPSSTPISSSSLMIGQQLAAAQHQPHPGPPQHQTVPGAGTQAPHAIHPMTQLSSSSPHEHKAAASASMTAASMTAAAAAAAVAVQQQQHLHHQLTSSHHAAVAAQQHHNQIQQFNYSNHNHHHPDLAQSPILEQFYSQQHHQGAGHHHHQRATMQQLHHQPYAANCYNPTY